MNKYLIIFEELKARYGIENDTEADELEKFLGSQGTEDRPILTEAGIAILEYLQKSDKASLKAKDIAEGMDLPSRKVSGSMRKLTTDGFVEKYGQNPVIYSLSEKGKTFDIASYKETISED